MSMKQICAGIVAVVTGCAFGTALAKLPPATDEHEEASPNLPGVSAVVRRPRELVAHSIRHSLHNMAA